MSAGTWSPPPSPDVEPNADPEVAAARRGWDRGASRRFVALAVARALTQVIGLGWFVVSARALGDEQFGLLATGLTFFAVFAGLGDLGMTRTIVRHVAAEPDLVWPAVRRTTVVRSAGGLTAGGLVLAVLWVSGSDVSLSVVALAALVATVSGVTELGYAALRSIGLVATEVCLLVAERGAFVALGLVAIHEGHGATGVLVAYLITNSASAVVVTAIAHHRRSPAPPTMPPLLDRQSSFTAVEFALATVSPRISPVLLTLFAAPATVGAFVAGQRPIEAISLLALSTAAPVLPIVRSRLVAGRPDAESAARAVIGALSTAMTPIVCWFVIAPDAALRVLFGAGRYPDAGIALRLLACTALTWSLRGVGEMVLLAREQAHTFLWIIATGAGVNMVLGALLVRSHGAAGVASATLVAELLMTALLVPRLTHRNGLAAIGRRGAAPLAIAGVTSVALVAVRSSTAATLAAVALASVAAVVVAAGRLRALDGVS